MISLGWNVATSLPRVNYKNINKIAQCFGEITTSFATRVALTDDKRAFMP